MSISKKDKISYTFFQIFITLLYAAFLLATPLLGQFRYQQAKRKYDASYFTGTLLAAVSSDADKSFIQSIYKTDDSGSRMVLKEKTGWTDRRKMSSILKKHDYKEKSSFGTYFYLLVALYFIRYIIALFYRDRKVNPDFEPTAAVIIPVKNEEDHIYETIQRCAENDYPIEKLDIIVINDGSTDNTEAEIKRAMQDYPSVKFRNFSVNRGKRMAITSAVKMTEAEYFVMLDSDTFLEKGAIRHLLQHFQDEKVAAVSGHTKVQNVEENFLTKAQGFKYFISYRLFKSFESVFGTVICAPGCFSAYRAKKFLGIMEEWHSKTFFGRRCVAGEDRSLTTLLLKDNKIKYADKAIASTFAPTTLKSFGIQQKRWMRSWFRESLYVAKFMWKKNPLPALSFYVMLFITMFAPITLVRECLLMPVMFGITPEFYLAALSLIIVTQAFFCVLTGKFRFSAYGFVFSILYFFYLVWMLPVAIFTVTSGNWGSRGAVFDPKKMDLDEKLIEKKELDPAITA